MPPRHFDEENDDIEAVNYLLNEGYKKRGPYK